MHRTVGPAALRLLSLPGLVVSGLLLGLGLAPVSARAESASASASTSAPGGRLGTGLPVPRYVSLKTDRVNLREGPSKDHRTAWVYQRAGLPVEIIAEYETWRRIRDSEGTEGWVLHSLLSGRRTALVQPWGKDTAFLPLHDGPNETGGIVAQLQPGVVASVKDCNGAWCEVVITRDKARDLTGYIHQDKLWGVYPDEKVE